VYEVAQVLTGKVNRGRGLHDPEGCADLDGSTGIPSYHGAREPKWRILRVTSKRAKKSAPGARAPPAQAEMRSVLLT
jgi:hypothetical protein